MTICYICEEEYENCTCLETWIQNLFTDKLDELENSDLLKLIKKEAKCKNNMELLNKLEDLSEVLRKWKRNDVYNDRNRYVVKTGSAIVKAELSPESEAKLEDDVLENTTGAMVD